MSIDWTMLVATVVAFVLAPVGLGGPIWHCFPHSHSSIGARLWLGFALKLTGRRRFALRAVASCLCLHHPLIGDDLLLASPAVTPVIAPDQFATHSLVTTGP